MALASRYQESILRQEWADRSKFIKKRDGNACKKCAAQDTVLHVHHRYYVMGRQPWEYPDGALVTLCHRCHAEEHLRKSVYYQEGKLELLRIELPDLYTKELIRSQTNESKFKKLFTERNKPTRGHGTNWSWIFDSVLMRPFRVLGAFFYNTGLLIARIAIGILIGSIIYWLVRWAGQSQQVAIGLGILAGILAFKKIARYLPKAEPL